MIDSQSAARKLRRFAHFAAAAAVLLAISPAAKAQGLFSFFGGGPSPYEIERRLDAGGYTLTGPLVRRGDVYLADVVVGTRRLRAPGDRRRDRAHHAAVSRSAGALARRRSARLGSRRAGSVGFGAAPAGCGSIARRRAQTLDLPRARPEPQASTREQLARGDDAAKPNVILAPGGARATSSDANKKPKPSDAKRKIVAPAQAAKPANPPAPAPGPPNPPPRRRPRRRRDAAGGERRAAPPPAPRRQRPRRAANGEAARPSVVATKSPPPAETPDGARRRAKSKPVNDLPVTPLD